jgi:hypothetical protein
MCEPDEAALLRIISESCSPDLEHRQPAYFLVGGMRKARPGPH